MEKDILGLSLHWKRLRQQLNDTLYINSFFLMLSKLFNTGAGFIFWILAARLFSIEDVGLTIAILSTLDLIKMFSTFGFHFSLIRFLPINNNKSSIFFTCLIITTCTSFILGALYLLGTYFFSFELVLLRINTYAAIFLLFAATGSIILITGQTFIAIRKSIDLFYQNILMAVRIPILFVLVKLESLGILGSIAIANLIASIFSLLRLNCLIGINIKIDKKFINESIRFSFGNYLAEALYVSPTLILPIMILKLLGEVDVAQYYIAFAVGNLVLIIPEAMGTSLFVEGSHGKIAKKTIRKTIIATYALLAPAVLLIYFLGGISLSLFGKDYFESLNLLRLLVLSSLIVAPFFLFIPLQNVIMRIDRVILFNLFRFLLILGLSYVFIMQFGTIGIGYAWIVTHMLLCICIILPSLQRKC